MPGTGFTAVTETEMSLLTDQEAQQRIGLNQEMGLLRDTWGSESIIASFSFFFYKHVREHPSASKPYFCLDVRH